MGAYRMENTAHLWISVETIMSEAKSSDLIQQIDADLRQAMLDRNEVAKLALRSVKTALTEARTSRADHSLNEAEVLAVVQKEAKRRRDAAAEYERVGAPQRAAAEQAELAVLAKYLPQQMGEGEIEEVAQRVITRLGATSPKQMGAVMSATMAEVGSKADGGLVSKVVRRLLSNETK